MYPDHDDVKAYHYNNIEKKYGNTIYREKSGRYEIIFCQIGGVTKPYLYDSQVTILGAQDMHPIIDMGIENDQIVVIFIDKQPKGVSMLFYEERVREVLIQLKNSLEFYKKFLNAINYYTSKPISSKIRHSY